MLVSEASLHLVECSCKRGTKPGHLSITKSDRFMASLKAVHSSSLLRAEWRLLPPRVIGGSHAFSAQDSHSERECSNVQLSHSRAKGLRESVWHSADAQAF